MADDIRAPAGRQLTTVSQTLHTCPASKRQVVEVIITNIDGVNDADATISWTDASAANASNPLMHLVTVAKKDVAVSPQKILEAGDTLTGLASANGDLHVSVNVVLEVDAP